MNQPEDIKKIPYEIEMVEIGLGPYDTWKRTTQTKYHEEYIGKDIYILRLILSNYEFVTECKGNYIGVNKKEQLPNYNKISKNYSYYYVLDDKNRVIRCKYGISQECTIL